ncbi:MAG: hypothetical protein JSS42_08955 [Proteobacteria bacterium]|uniref:insecticidal delta-endotoxin Cry8Ea1 family protein n=1 Tax=Rudaea sp. TaxID=2136325 RepID=UPI0032207457|nr:hypothetical protein [Pseudomonadota bacterium]
MGRREALRRLTHGAAAVAAGIPALVAATEAGPDGTYVPKPSANCPRLSNLNPRSDLTLPALDPINDIKTVLNIGISFIPMFGSGINLLINLFWPTSQQDLWSQIKEQVLAAIDQQAEKDAVNGLKNTIDGFKTVLASYAFLVKTYNDKPSTSGLADVIAKAGDVESAFELGAPAFMNPSNQAWQGDFLPLFVQMANLHLVFLRDILWHGRKIGFDDTSMQGFQHDYDTFNKQYCDHVDAVAPGALAKFGEEYTKETQSPLPDDAWHDKSYYPGVAAVAWGAWNAKRTQNERTSQLTHLALDYRQLWPTMADSSANRQPVRLTRELLYGPYGAPDWQDIGVDFNMTDHYYYFTVDPPYPTVPAPEGLPDTPLVGLAVSTGALINRGGRNFNFPSAVATFRQGETQTPVPYGALYLTDLAAHPIVGVKVDIGFFGAQTSSRCSSGYLVSALYFTQRVDNGDGSFTPRPSVIGTSSAGWEMKSFSSNVVPVPEGHMLSRLDYPSSVFELYRCLGKSPTALTYHSLGCVVFGFRLIDPDVKIKPSQLVNLYVTSPTEMSLADVHQALVRARTSQGASVSDAQATQWLDEIAQTAERFFWEEQRQLFWKQMQAMAQHAS